MAKDNNTSSRRRGASPASREENSVENVDLNTELSAQCKLSDVDRMTATLPLWELAIYFLGWSGAIAYGCYDVYLASAKSKYIPETTCVQLSLMNKAITNI